MTKRVFTSIAGVYDRMNRLLSLGLDRRWRRQAVRLAAAQAPQPSVIDLACGTGDLTAELARAFPAAKILGLDFTPAMLEIARRKNRFPHVTFAEADAERLRPPSFDLQPSAVDLVSCAFGFRNFCDRQAVLRNVRTLLAPHGQLLVLEFFRPVNPLLGAFTALWLSLLSRLFARDRKDAYAYLRRSMRQTLSEREFVELAKSEGLFLVNRQFFLPCCSCLLLAKRED